MENRNKKTKLEKDYEKLNKEIEQLIAWNVDASLIRNTEIVITYKEKR